jgi:hypothetical protein
MAGQAPRGDSYTRRDYGCVQTTVVYPHCHPRQPAGSQARTGDPPHSQPVGVVMVAIAPGAGVLAAEAGTRLPRHTVAMAVAVVAVVGMETGTCPLRQAAASSLHGAVDNQRPSTATPSPILHAYS